MAFPAYQTSATGSAIGSASAAVDRPSGTADGDLLIVAVCTIRGSGYASVNSIPSGWNSLNNGNAFVGTVYSKMYVYWKIASSEPSTWTWGFNTNTNHVWISARFDTMDATTPLAIANIDMVNNSTSPSWANTITPSTSDGLMCAFVFASQTNTISAFAITTDNPTWNTRQTSGDGNLKLLTAERSQTSATGNSSATLSSGIPGTPSICSIFSIKRVTEFSNTISETVTATDTQTSIRGLFQTFTETLTTIDILTALKSRLWTKKTKPTTTWTKKIK